ncbi:MAG TPA: MgtC/SapB family protein [Candidatus Acidoferrum sp.]|jgi:putative Mg2+ transporter-C (MgtC) family protein|nr:MgtC/SapB family protein [Candidatus Acidoferrum sp.]
MHFSFDWLRGWEDVLKLAIAYFLALPVGWHRESEAHSVGVRTFPIVAVAACGYILLGAPSEHMSQEGQSRIIQGLVTGIGFIGGAAILKSENHVRGSATAASIWCTGVLGAAVAQNRYLLAVALMLLNLFALRFLLPLKQQIDKEQPRRDNDV